MTKDEIECIVEEAVDKAVTRVLTSFGIDERTTKKSAPISIICAAGARASSRPGTTPSAPS